MSDAIVTPDGWFRLGAKTYRACIGRGGVSPAKEEGDGATPAGLLPLRRVLYRADRVAPPRASVPLEPIGPEDGWCDDPRDPAYNRMIRRPFAARHERLWRDDRLYDVIGVLGWNDDPVQPGRGSAIFLHVTAPDRRPTEGCVALDPPDLLAALAMGLGAIHVVLM